MNEFTSNPAVLIWLPVALGVIAGAGLAFVVWRIKGPLRRFADIAIYVGGIGGLHFGLTLIGPDAPAIYQDTATRLALFLSLALLLKVFLLLIGFLIAKALLRQARSMVMMISELLSVVLVFVLFVGMIFEKPVPEMLAVAVVALGAAGFMSKRVLENISRGIMLSLQPSLNIGNFIDYEGRIGKVREITTTHLIVETPLKESFLIPHAKIYENSVINYSRPELDDRDPLSEVIGRDIGFRLGLEHSPTEVQASIRQFLERAREQMNDLIVSYDLAEQVSNAKDIRAKEPIEAGYRPRLFVDEFGDYYIAYRLRVFFLSFGDYFAGGSRIRTDLYDHFYREEGWRIPHPIMRLDRGEQEAVAVDRAPPAQDV